MNKLKGTIQEATLYIGLLLLSLGMVYVILKLLALYAALAAPVLLLLFLTYLYYKKK